MSKFHTNIFLIATTSNYFWSSVVGVAKVDYFDYSHKKFEKLECIRCMDVFPTHLVPLISILAPKIMPE